MRISHRSGRIWKLALPLCAVITYATIALVAHPSVANTVVERKPAAAGIHPPMENDWIVKLRRAPIDAGASADLFARHAAPVAKQGAAPPPVVPAFPFSYMGKIAAQGGVAKVFLSRGDDWYAAAPGKLLGDQYKVKAVRDDGLDLVYLPLKRKISIAFSAMPAPLAPAWAENQAQTSTPTIAAASGIVGATQPYSDSASTVTMAPQDGGSYTPNSSSDGQSRAAAPATEPSGTGLVNIPGMDIRPPTSTTMPIFPPTSTTMPISPPTADGMPILPASPGPMPFLPPQPGATMPMPTPVK